MQTRIAFECFLLICLISFSLSLSLSLSETLFNSLSIFINLFIFLSFYLAFFVSVFLSDSLSLSLSFSLSLNFHFLCLFSFSLPLHLIVPHSFFHCRSVSVLLILPPFHPICSIRLCLWIRRDKMAACRPRVGPQTICCSRRKCISAHLSDFCPSF